MLKKLIVKLKGKRFLKDRYPQYQIGRGTYGHPKVRSWGDGSTLNIGAFCSFASGVKILLGGNHQMDHVTTFPFTALWDLEYKEKPNLSAGTKGDVVIGNDVWIGTEAMILSGVTIGDGAVIGARAVVARDIPPYAIAVGNPAKVVNMRFDEAIIQQLLESKWWNWDDALIEDSMHLLLNNDIKSFLEFSQKQRNLKLSNA